MKLWQFKVCNEKNRGAYYSQADKTLSDNDQLSV